MKRRLRQAQEQMQAVEEEGFFGKLKVALILLFLLLLLFLLTLGLSQRAGEEAFIFSRKSDEAMQDRLSRGRDDEVEEEGSFSSLEDVPLEDPDVESDEMFPREVLEAAKSGTGCSELFCAYKLPGMDIERDGIFIKDGTLSNAYRSSIKKPKTGLDLPRVFAVDDLDQFFSDLKNKRTVCVFTRTPRQDSIFRTNLMSISGSQIYNYVIMRSTDCQHNGICKSGEEARAHPSCDPNMNPTVHLLERIRNFQHERFEQVLTNAMKYYDIIVATGDEFCRAKGTYDRAHFRNYAGTEVVNGSLSTPVYLPLGAREEFKRVKPSEVRLALDREYVFNFVGSLTSFARKVLAKEFKTKLSKVKNFVHIAPKWKKQVTKANGYVLPGEYRKILLNSVFTLCPQGHNPEAYRIYEAIEAGSIPIVTIDEFYRSHECQGAFKPLITQGAPFVFLNSWSELSAFLEKIWRDPERIQQMQIDTMEWYSKFMHKVASQFETVMKLRFQDRGDQGDFTSTNSLESLEDYLRDPKYVHPL